MSAHQTEKQLLDELVRWALQPRKDQRNYDAAQWMAKQVRIFAAERGIELDDE